MDMKDYLKLMVKYDASDLYFTTGAAVSAKIQGILNDPGQRNQIINELGLKKEEE